MSPQLILRIAGIAALVIAALFAVLAVHYYLTQDIRGVMDDLSGKARARGVAGTRRRASERSTAGPSRQGRAAAAVAPVRQGEVQAAPAVAAPADPVPAPMPAFALADEAGPSTMLVAAGRTEGVVSAPPAHDVEDDLETMVAPEGKEPPVGTSPSSGFHLTKSIVMIHSQEIIAEIEE